MCFKVQKRYLVLIFMLVVMILIGSFYDLDISKSVYIGQYPNENMFGIIFSYIGVIPTFVGWGFLGTIILYLSKNETHRKKRIVLKSFSIFQYLLSFLFLSNTIMFTNLDVIEVHWTIAYGIGIIIFLLSVYLGYLFVRKNNNKLLLNHTLFISLISVVAMILAMGIKELMARPRYIFVLEMNNYDYFLNWWENGHAIKNLVGDSVSSEAFKSFPSGHSTYSMFAIFMFPFLAKNKDNSSKYELVLFISGLIWWFLTSYSRITIGAHYLTDVCFGGLIVVLSYLIVMLIYKRRLNK